MREVQFYLTMKAGDGIADVTLMTEIAERIKRTFPNTVANLKISQTIGPELDAEAEEEWYVVAELCVRLPADALNSGGRQYLYQINGPFSKRKRAERALAQMLGNQQCVEAFVADLEGLRNMGQIMSVGTRLVSAISNFLKRRDALQPPA